MFITFEGIDGVGKTTQVGLFCEYLRKYFGSGKVIQTKEPGGTDFGMRVREVLKTEPKISLASQFHLVEAQRFHHVGEVIGPNLNLGKFVVCDRYVDTSYAYQHGYLNEDQWIEYLSGHPHITPDVTFLLSTNNVLGMKKRMSGRDEVADHFDDADEINLTVKQNLYALSASYFPDRIITVNADRSIEEVHQDIVNTINLIL